MGRPETDEKVDDVCKAWAVYRGGPSASTSGARQSNSSGCLKQAEASVAASCMSKMRVQSEPVVEDPPGYEEGLTAVLARQDDADVRTALSESRVEVETTKLFGVPVLKRTFRLMTLEGSPHCVAREGGLL